MPALTVCLVVCCFGAARAEERPTLDSALARVEIRVNEKGKASVHEEYSILPEANREGSIEFQYFADPCAQIENLSIQSMGSPISFSERPHGSLIFLRAGSPAADRSAPQNYTLHYEIQVLGQPGNVPILLPSFPLRARLGPDKQTADVMVSLSFDGSGIVLLPQLQRTGGAGQWSGTFPAVPAFVRLELETGAANPECGNAIRPAEKTRSFEWRFYGFVITLFAWVFLYLWWARLRG